MTANEKRVQTLWSASAFDGGAEARNDFAFGVLTDVPPSDSDDHGGSSASVTVGSNPDHTARPGSLGRTLNRPQQRPLRHIEPARRMTP